MKVGILIPGLIKNYYDTLDNLITKILLPNKDCDIDIYIYTSNKKDVRFNEFYKNIDVTNEDVSFIKDQIQNRTSAKIINFIIEPLPNFDISAYLKHSKFGDLHSGSDGQHVISMFFYIKKCFDLLSNSNKSYDLVVRHRFDLMFEEEIHFKQIKKEYITIPGDVNGGDHFAISSQENMSVYCDTFTNICNIVPAHSRYNPHAILAYQIKDIEKYLLNVSNYLLRPWPESNKNYAPTNTPYLFHKLLY